MTDDTRANLFLCIGLGSLAGIVADALLYPAWWILAPLIVVLILDAIWGLSL